MPCFDAEKIDVTTLPLMLAVAPVNSSVPRFPRPPSFPPFKSISFSLNRSTASRENANAAPMLVSSAAVMSSGVMERKGLKTACPALKSAARMEKEGEGNFVWMAVKAPEMDLGE
jgi:hypothetical protein